MMKKKIFVIASAIAATAITAGAFAGCSGCNGDKPEGTPLTDKPLTGSVLANFTDGEMPDVMYASDGWTNGSVFNTQWSADCASLNNGALHLSIAENEDGSEETNNEYFSGEVRTYQYFGYGDYTVKMKPAKKVGTASTFFSYTGPGDEEEGEDPAPHDEIDIEFLGKDPTMVQFNYFVNGKGGHEYLYHLGFDASEEYHEYGYRWTEEYIVWFVDGTPVHKVEASAENPMPSHPSRIFMNYWCGTEEAYEWMGEYSNPGAESTDYQWVKCSATPIGEIPEKPDDIGASDIPEEGWENIGYSSFGGWSGGAYTVNKTNGLTISHTAAVNEWKCEGMELSKSYSWVKFNVKNNDTVKANIRLDIKQKGQTDGDEGIGGIEGFYCEDEDIDIKCDPLNYSAAITVGGGKSADVVLKIRDIEVNQLVLFLNSMQSSGGVATGSITITGLQGIVKDGEEDPEKPDPENPDPGKPDPGEPDPITGEGESLTFTTTNEKYTITPAEGGKTVNVTYSGIMNDYSNIAASLGSLANGKTTFTFTVENNGENEVVLRADLQKDGTNCNTNISATGGDAWQQDSSYFKVAAGKTATVTVTFSGDPSVLILFIDSTIWEDEKVTEYSGDITIGNFKLSGTATVTPAPEGDPVELTFTSTQEFTVDKSGEAATEITVSYTDIAGGTYKNIQAAAATLAADNNTFSLKIKNNGDSAVTVRVDLIGERQVTVGGNANMDVCNTASTGTGCTSQRTDTEWGGTYVTIEADATADITITYSNENAMGAVQRVQLYLDTAVYGDSDTHSGNVTFSNFIFS